MCVCVLWNIIYMHRYCCCDPFSFFFHTATSYPLVPSMFYRRNNEVGFRDRVVDVDDDD